VSGGLFPQRKSTGVWWRDHSLSLALGAIMLVQMAMVFGFGWMVYSSDQRMHKQPVTITGYLADVGGYSLPLSLIADTYGVLLIVVLSKWLRERGSAESN
jgi:hypothetical protein